VSWGYYVVAGTEPDAGTDAAVSCVGVKQKRVTPGIWNPLPYFDTVRNDNELGNIHRSTTSIPRQQGVAAAVFVVGRAVRSGQ